MARMAAGRSVDRLAAVASEVLAPTVLAAVMAVVVGVAAAPSWGAGLGWGLLVLVFVAALPYAAVRLLMRRGRIDSGHHVRERRQRALPIGIALASILVGLALLLLLDAPRDLVAFAIVFVVGAIVLGLANLVWKLSGHAAVAAASAVGLSFLLGPWILIPAGALVALVSWSRVRLGDHTLAQVCAGVAVGAAIALTVWPLATA